MQRSRSHINVDNVKIFLTPRKLFYSLQDPSSENSDISKKQSRQFRSPCRSKFESSPSRCDQTSFSHHSASMCDQYGFLRNVNHETSKDDLSLTSKESQGSSKSVASLENVQLSQKSVPAVQAESLKINVLDQYPMSIRSVVCVVFALLFAASFCLFWIGGDQDEVYYLHPT